MRTIAPQACSAVAMQVGALPSLQRRNVMCCTSTATLRVVVVLRVVSYNTARTAPQHYAVALPK